MIKKRKCISKYLNYVIISNSIDIEQFLNFPVEVKLDSTVHKLV